MADRESNIKYYKKHPFKGKSSSKTWSDKKRKQRIEDSTRFVDLELDFHPKKGQ